MWAKLNRFQHYVFHCLTKRLWIIDFYDYYTFNRLSVVDPFNKRGILNNKMKRKLNEKLTLTMKEKNETINNGTWNKCEKWEDK